MESSSWNFCCQAILRQPLWPSDYAGLKTAQAQKTQGRSFDNPQPQEFRQRTSSRKTSIALDNYGIIWTKGGWQGGIWQILLKFLSMSCYFCMAQQRLVFTIYSFSSSRELTSFPLKSHTPIPFSLFQDDTYTPFACLGISMYMWIWFVQN